MDYNWQSSQITKIIEILQTEKDGYKRMITDMEYSLLKYLESEALKYSVNTMN